MQEGSVRRASGIALACTLLLAGIGVVDAGDGAAPAPERTVASAQAFLEQILPGNRYVSTPMTEMLAKAKRENLRGSFEPLPQIYEAQPVAHCVTRLLADVSPTWFIVLDPQDSWNGVEASLEALLDSPVIGNPDGMHFGSIRALARFGSRVNLRFAGNSDDAVLHLDAAETAERVHQALEFLRVQCDATRETGF